ncbi:class I SAM-dependent methyltransferase [Mesoterricola sediminis]|uniref:Ribosomal RNA adenine methylase transferase N-terminal domain-containing protein n=1 Tax=Mesoterricola sediminis TaxID=2927980 RepID=A0AA48KDI5_9BACT|nr:methyltransferase [Mesoterricola sediminis]BDU77105.1 hypothetical protein METESE_20630 [Mesoterricola sediminis]
MDTGHALDSAPRPWLAPLVFLGRALASPRRFGAVLPSGEELARTLARLARGQTLVELGPGTGSVTRHLLRGLGPGGRLLGLELDPGIAALLQRHLPDPRLQVRLGDAGGLEAHLEALGWGRADTVISGLPLRNFTGAERDRILAAARAALVPGGRFVAFQYGLGLLPELRAHFRLVRVVGPILRNVPPAYVLIGRP